MDIKPIETYYKGYRFRSRLEARWAVFFDALGIKYQYEPQGFRMVYGMRYLPDFALYNIHWRGEHASAYTGKPGSPLYVEIKGADKYSDIRIDDRVRMEAFSKRFPLIVLGNIPRNDIEVISPISMLPSFQLLDGDSYPGFFTLYNEEVWFCGPDHDEYRPGSTDRALAYARQARFEYGETPYIEAEDIPF
jgi:hypothetical protein